MKKQLIFITILLMAVGVFAPAFAKQQTVETHMESVIMLDVARRYYTVDEIKGYIDVLSEHDNGTLQLHFTDDENVGIECEFLDQTVEYATESDGVYTNPVTGKQFLSYAQVKELMDYAANKKVELIPEIDMPAHMNGFFTLAINKFGEYYVRNHYDWDNPANSGIAWGTGAEAGNLDLMAPHAKPFAKSLLNEYTRFFAGQKYFHIGFDEYTFRPEMKIDYANELYDYLVGKGFQPRIWSDLITKDNLSELNNGYEVTYWGWKQDDIVATDYATVPDLQNAGFKVIITNKYYLFFVPSLANTTEEVMASRISNIENEWELEKWNYNFDGGLDSHDGILGAMIAVWGEDSDGVENAVINNHAKDMYRAMFPKLDVYTETIDIDDEDEEEKEDVVPDDEEEPEEVVPEDESEEDIEVPDTGVTTAEKVGFGYGISIASGVLIVLLWIIYYIRLRKSEHQIIYRK